MRLLSFNPSSLVKVLVCVFSLYYKGRVDIVLVLFILKKK